MTTTDALTCTQCGDNRPTTCGICNRSWCADCDPCPSALCHWCHGGREDRSAGTDSPAEAAFREYAATGEVTGLLALADYLCEQGESVRSQKLLRQVAKKRDGDVRFFFANAGVTWAGLRDRMRGLKLAIDLAKAEDWFEANEFDGYPYHDGNPRNGELHFRWVEDPFDWEDDSPSPAWEGILQGYENGWYVVSQLSGVTFADGGYPEDADYARVVQAEMCLEAMNKQRRKR